MAGVLEREGLQGLLKIEGALLNEIRELDGERKALVYDNYSKLIAATDTIKGMRRNMAPLGANTGDLKGMVERIAGTVGELSGSAVEGKKGAGLDGPGSTAVRDAEKAGRQREMVRWVVKGPERLRRLVADDNMDEAEKQWGMISKLLDKWAGVAGVDEIRQHCQEALNTSASSDGED